MFHPLPLFVGLRYVRARTHKFFVSFITWASVVGVCVGVAALIVILSVMNGFEDELRDRLLALTSGARVVAKESEAPTPDQWRAAEATIRGAKGVVAVAPYAELQALAVHAPETLPVLVRGIEPEAELRVTDVGGSITQGKLADLIPGEDRVLVGPVAAERLGLGVGDTLSLLIPTVGDDGTPTAKLREVTVVGAFDAGQPDTNESGLLFAPIDDVRALAPAGDHGLRVRFADALAAPALAAQLRTLLPKSFQVIDWTQDNASYFRAIRIEKTMMALILMLIVAVAAFNIVSMLVMVVTDKRTDIAILRTFGASPRKVMGVFITQGLVIGWLGVALGVAIGLAIAFNVGTIEPFLERTFGFHILDADIYVNVAIPSDVKWPNIVAISIVALLLTGLATLYPAMRAARTAPAEALRYE
jgi:lipoprotein-releasing system permease protein